MWHKSYEKCSYFKKYLWTVHANHRAPNGRFFGGNTEKNWGVNVCNFVSCCSALPVEWHGYWRFWWPGEHASSPSDRLRPPIVAPISIVPICYWCPWRWLAIHCSLCVPGLATHEFFYLCLNFKIREEQNNSSQEIFVQPMESWQWCRFPWFKDAINWEKASRIKFC